MYTRPLVLLCLASVALVMEATTSAVDALNAYPKPLAESIHGVPLALQDDSIIMDLSNAYSHVLDPNYNQMLLSRLGIPFSFSGNSIAKIVAFIDVVIFMDPVLGACLAPSSISSTVRLYFLLHPQALASRYGVERLQSLQWLRIPSQWRLVMSDKVGPDVRAAEEYIASLPLPNLPGTIRIAQQDGWPADEMYNELPLADFSVKYDGLAIRWPPHLQLHAFEPMLRSQRHKRLVEKVRYAAGIARYDELLREERERIENRTVDVIRRHYKAIQFEVQLKRNWAAYVQRKRVVPRQSDKKGIPPTIKRAGQLRYSKDGVEPSLLSTSRYVIKCRHVQRALDTLNREGASARDPRRQRLLEMASQYPCNVNTSASESPKFLDLSPLSQQCEDYCHSLQHLHKWHQHTGQSTTISQWMALLFSLFRNSSIESPRASDEEDGPLSEGRQIVGGFQEFILHFVRVHVDMPCHSRCPLPAAMKGELHYMLAVSQLLHPFSHRGPGGDTESVRWAQAILQLQQAMWWGSMHAAATLATLREHGILMRQHSKASAALLTFSMMDTPSYLFLQMLESAGVAEKLAGQEGHRVSSGLSPQRLLRFVRFYADNHDWSMVDFPLNTRDSVSTVFVTDEQDLEGEEEQSEEESREHRSDGAPSVLSLYQRQTTRVANLLERATMLIAGFKDVPQNLVLAECLLLTALRKLRYSCDADKGYVFFEGAPSYPNDAEQEEMDTHWGAAFMEKLELSEDQRMDRTCHTHKEELAALRRDPVYTRICCAPLRVGVSRPLSEQPVLNGDRFYVPQDYLHYTHLQRAITLLSYVYLLDQRYHLAAKYAALSVRLSASAYAVAMDSVRRAAYGKEVEMPMGELHATYYLLMRFRMRAGREWSGSLLMANILNGVIDEPWVLGFNFSKWMKNVVERLPPFADSPFVTHEPFLLLAVSTLLDSSQKSRIDEGERPTSDWFAQRLLEDVYGIRGTVTASDQRRLCTSIYLLITAAKMSKWDKTATQVLDNTIASQHRIDSFVVLVWVLRAAARGPNGTALLDTLLGEASAYHSLLGDKSLLPMRFDTVNSYTNKLLRFASRHVGRVDALLELLRNGLTTTTPRQRYRLLQDAPLPFYSMESLRRVKDLRMEVSQLRPLLYASDLHEYLASSRRAVMHRLRDYVMNKFYYLFTETTEEHLLRLMGVAVLPLTETRWGYFERSKPAPFVGQFMESFGAFSELREFCIAVQLLSTALEAGRPQGFSLLLLEVVERGNPYLRPIADYVSDDVFGPSSAAVWRDAYNTAQWHASKPRTKKFSASFTLDLRSPFRDASAESRQEFFARVDLWRAQRWLKVARSLSDVNVAQRLRYRARDTLALCSGYMISVAVASGLADLPSSPYDSMLFPAADPQCLLELRQLEAQEMRGTTAVINTEYMRVLNDLSRRASYFYSLTQDPPRDLLHPLPTPHDHISVLQHPQNPLEEADDAVDASDDTLITQLVEPWNTVRGALARPEPAGYPQYGEGVYYNARLHRYSGMYWGSRLFILWFRVRSFAETLLSHLSRG